MFYYRHCQNVSGSIVKWTSLPKFIFDKMPTFIARQGEAELGNAQNKLVLFFWTFFSLQNSNLETRFMNLSFNRFLYDDKTVLINFLIVAWLLDELLLFFTALRDDWLIVMFAFERVIFNIPCSQQSSREAIISGIKWNGEHGGGGVRLEGGGDLAQWQQPQELDHQGAVSEMHSHFLYLT